MKAHDPKPAGRSETIRVRAGRDLKDQRGDATYAADLAAATDRSLRKSRRWLAGKALADHRATCDCPPSLAGCVERRTWPTQAELPRGESPNKGRWST